jgi:hypothetical protein
MQARKGNRRQPSTARGKAGKSRRYAEDSLEASAATHRGWRAKASVSARIVAWGLGQWPPYPGWASQLSGRASHPPAAGTCRPTPPVLAPILSGHAHPRFSARFVLAAKAHVPSPRGRPTLPSRQDLRPGYPKALAGRLCSAFATLPRPALAAVWVLPSSLCVLP